MALLPVLNSGLTGLETSWALLTIAAWLRLLQSLAWLKLYFRVFGQANYGEVQVLFIIQE